MRLELTQLSLFRLAHKLCNLDVTGGSVPGKLGGWAAAGRLTRAKEERSRRVAPRAAQTPKSLGRRLMLLSSQRLKDAIISPGEFVKVRSAQFSSVAQSCPTLCDPTNRSTPSLPVHHQILLKIKQNSPVSRGRWNALPRFGVPEEGGSEVPRVPSARPRPQPRRRMWGGADEEKQRDEVTLKGGRGNA